MGKPRACRTSCFANANQSFADARLWLELVDIDIDMLGAVRAWRAPTRAEKTAQQWASEVATYASDDLGVR